MDKSVSCEYCNSVHKNRASYRTHKSNYHRNEQQSVQSFRKTNSTDTRPFQSQTVVTHAAYLKRPKTDEEFVNEYLDNNKHLYDDEEWDNLKRNANGAINDRSDHRFPKENPAKTKSTSDNDDFRQLVKNDRKARTYKVQQRYSKRKASPLEDAPKRIKRIQAPIDDTDDENKRNAWNSLDEQMKKRIKRHYTKLNGGFCLKDIGRIIYGCDCCARDFKSRHSQQRHWKKYAVCSRYASEQGPSFTILDRSEADRDRNRAVSPNNDRDVFSNASHRAISEENSIDSSESNDRYRDDEETDSTIHQEEPLEVEDVSSESEELESEAGLTDTSNSEEEWSAAETPDASQQYGQGLDIAPDDLEIHQLYYDNWDEIDNNLAEIIELIDQRQYKTLASNAQLLNALKVVFLGYILGVFKLDRRKKAMLTKPMKRLIYKFGTTENVNLLMRNRDILRELFKILKTTV